MNMSEHLEFSHKPRERQVIEQYSKSYFSYDYLCTFLPNRTLVITQLQSAREYLCFINEVVGLGQVKESFIKKNI